MKSIRLLGALLAGFCLLLLALWEAMAIYYSNLPGAVRPLAAAVFALIALALIIRGFRRRESWGALLALWSIIFLWWWFAIKPSQERNWQPDVRVLPRAEIDGNRVTVHNVRNCDYRSEKDYQVRHYDRTFDLRQMRSADIYLVYWGSPHIAHTMLSFGFSDGSYLCFSVETRKEVGEDYSAIKGFFKQFELTYVVADERDVVRLRTNYRKDEEVYLYRLKVPTDVAKEIFLDYLREVNSLKEHPQWYRALVTNCTTGARRHTTPFVPDAGFDWRMVANGHIDEWLYERGILDRSLPFPELKRRSNISERARSLAGTADFSRAIRAGVPGGAFQ